MLTAKDKKMLSQHVGTYQYFNPPKDQSEVNLYFVTWQTVHDSSKSGKLGDFIITWQTSQKRDAMLTCHINGLEALIFSTEGELF